jgi:hypothetical protein
MCICSNRLYVAYSTVYILGTLLSMQITFVGFQPVQSSEHMAAFGVFGLLQLVGGFNWVRGHMSAESFYTFARTSILTIIAVVVAGATVATLTGCIHVRRVPSLILLSKKDDDCNQISPPGPVVSTLSSTPPTPRTTFPLLRPSLNINLPPGPPSSSISTSSSSSSPLACTSASPSLPTQTSFWLSTELLVSILR